MTGGSVVCISGVGGTPGEWRDAVAGLPGHGPLILIGHSQGGVEALRIAAGRPGRVGALVLSSCFYPPARGDRSFGAAVVDYARHRALYLRELAARDRPPRPTRRGAGQLASMAGLGLAPARFHRLADDVDCPVLLVHGGRDHVVPIAFARAAASRHPAWAFRELPPAGHHPHRDRAAEWSSVVGRWLATVRSG